MNRNRQIEYSEKERAFLETLDIADLAENGLVIRALFLYVHANNLIPEEVEQGIQLEGERAEQVSMAYNIVARMGVYTNPDYGLETDLM